MLAVVREFRFALIRRHVDTFRTRAARNVRDALPGLEIDATNNVLLPSVVTATSLPRNHAMPCGRRVAKFEALRALAGTYPSVAAALHAAGLSQTYWHRILARDAALADHVRSLVQMLPDGTLSITRCAPRDQLETHAVHALTLTGAARCGYLRSPQ